MDTNARLNRLRSVLELLALLVVPLLVVQGFRAHLDFHTSDEVHYYRAGVEFLTGERGLDVAWSPFYSLVYGVLDRLPLGSVHVFDAMFVLVLVFVGVSAWWGARAMVPSGLAFVLALWLVTSDHLTSADRIVSAATTNRTMVNAFGLGQSFLVVGCLSRRKFGCGLLVLVCLWLTRGEIGVVAIATGMLYLWSSRTERALRSPGLWLLGLGLVACAVVLVHPSYRQRSQWSFQQNWSYTDLQLAGTSSLESGDTVFSERRFRRAFPSASTPVEALGENPDAFWRHVSFNLRDLPRALVSVLGSGFSTVPWLRILALVVFVALLVIRLRVSPRSRERPGALYLWATLAVIPILLLIQPRGRMVFPLLPAFLIGLARLVAPAMARLRPTPATALVGWVVPAGLILVFALTTPPFAAEARRPPINRTCVDWIRRLLPDRTWSFLSTEGRSTALLAGRGALRASSIAETSDRVAPLRFDEILAATAPDIVLLDPNRAILEQHHAGILRSLSMPAWQRFELEPGFDLFLRTSSSEMADFGRELVARGFAVYERKPPSLTADVDTISIARGGVQTLRIDAGEQYAGYDYFVVGSMTGSAPGISLGAVAIPLNAGPYFNFLVGNPNTLVVPSLGRLDAQGRSEARLRIPAGLAQLEPGLEFHHAYVVFKLGYPMLFAASPAVRLVFVE